MGSSLRTRLALVAVIAAAALFALLPQQPARAQPFAGYLDLPGPGYGGVDVPHDAALSPTDAITIEAWINLRTHEDHLGGCAIILHKTFPDGYGFFVCPTGELRFYAQGTTGQVDSIISPPLNDWTHVAITYDSATVRFYIDGVLDTGTGSATGPLDVSASALGFGYIDGSIDEVRLWNVARSQAEIQAGMNSPAAGNEPGLVAVWHLDTNLLDGAGDHDGSLDGTAAFFGVKGDVNCNGLVQATDALHILRHVATLPSTIPGTCAPVAQTGDVNCTDGVTAVDALQVLRRVAGLPVNLPVGCAPFGQ